MKNLQEIIKKLDIKRDRFTCKSDFIFENKTTEVLEDLRKTRILHDGEFSTVVLLKYFYEKTNFRGNLAIYLLYIYDRFNSILEKANYCGFEEDVYKFQEKLEYPLINGLYNFSDVTYSSYNIQKSVVVMNYLYDVPQIFSKYYPKIPISTEKNELILVLLNSTKTVLSNGMKILGINLVRNFSI